MIDYYKAAMELRSSGTPRVHCLPSGLRELDLKEFTPEYYLEHYATHLDDYLTSLDKCVKQVFGSASAPGDIHPHLRKNGTLQDLLQAHEEMLNYCFKDSCNSFEELYAEIEELLKDIPSIGSLEVYDIALRFGWHHPRRVTPKNYVYLHTAIKDIAEELSGKKFDEDRVPVEILLESVAPLSEARHIEDYLCLYALKKRKLV